MAVEELQEVLDCPSKTLYYQVGKLMRAGLLTEAGSSRGSRRERLVYRALEGVLRMPEGFQGARYERLAAQSAVATLRAAIRRFRETADLAERQPELVDALFIEASTLKLTDEDVKALKQSMTALVEEYGRRETPGGSSVSMVCVLTPHDSRLTKSRE